MADGRIETPPTPDRITLKDRNLRRNSTGKTSTSGSGEKVVPHYLRASTNSCHEFCKYGRKHAFEEVGNRPTLKEIRKKMVESQKVVKNLTQLDKKKKQTIKPKASPDQPIQLLETPKSIKKETTLFKRTNVPGKPATAKSSLSSLSTSGGVMGRKNSDNRILKTAGGSKLVQKKVVVLPKASLSPRFSANKLASLITKSKVPKTVPSPMKNQKKVKKEGSNLPNREEVREKTLYVIEPKPEEEISEPRCSLTHLSSPTLPLPDGEVEKELHEGEVEEEEYVESMYTTDDENEAISESDETENGNPVDKEKYKRRSRTMVHVEDEELVRKLNFRRGKVVNPQAENNGARRLRFNRARALENNRNGENDSRRTFRKREVDDGDRNSSKPEPENVVLRHQDVHDKKDTQGLLNNVTEETASKLVEKRKSKVKALVGAFETVISLQESKPSTTTTS